MENQDIKFLTPVKEYGIFTGYCEIAHTDHFWVRWRFEVLRRFIKPELFDGLILDVGCGNGVVRKQLEDSYGIPVSGCDLDLKVLKLVPPGQGEVYFYDINQKEGSLKEKYSTLLLMDVLEHIAQPVAFLESARYHLKNDGRLILNVPAWPHLYSSFDSIQGHVKRYTPSALKSELEAAGFKVEKLAYWGLSLLPMFWMRKLCLNFCPKEKAVAVSFSMPGFVNRILCGIMKTELFFLGGTAPWGTSIMAQAVRK